MLKESTVLKYLLVLIIITVFHPSQISTMFELCSVTVIITFHVDSSIP